MYPIRHQTALYHDSKQHKTAWRSQQIWSGDSPPLPLSHAFDLVGRLVQQVSGQVLILYHLTLPFPLHLQGILTS